MIRVRPAFCDRFSCRAARCRHSCCVGWEIDVDERTRQLYEALPGALGDELRDAISDGASAHFILREDERCPFLRCDGLCRLILELGEDALCEICREHPRFYNVFPGREERGLGLCCEEAVRLLLEEEKLSFLVEDDGNAERGEPWREKLAGLREAIFQIASDRSLPFEKRLDTAFALLGDRSPVCRPRAWADFFLTLEQMEESWTKLLKRLASEKDRRPAGSLDDPRYEKLFSYMLYRHFITAEDLREAGDLLFFCAVGTLLVAALDRIDPCGRDEHIRLFSAEIEYSDENVGKICAMHGQSFDFTERI